MIYQDEDGELRVTKEDDIVFTFLACDIAEFLIGVLRIEAEPGNRMVGGAE